MAVTLEQPCVLIPDNTLVYHLDNDVITCSKVHFSGLEIVSFEDATH
jgi:hypothetical protein